MAPDGVFRIALFGAGRIGRIHAGNIARHPRSALAAVVDPLDGPARTLARRHGARVAAEREILDDTAIDALVVASATNTHANLVEAGILAGKAVFCEKPLDLSIDRVNRCLAAIEGRPEPLVMGFNRRFDPGVRELKRRIDAGVIGAVELVTVVSKDPGGGLPMDYLRASGGLFRDMTIHDFDMVRFLLGEEPARVSAAAAALTDPDIAAADDIDTASITLQTPGGRIAVITNSRRASFGYDQRVEVHGSLGALRTENPPATTLVQEREDGVLREKPLYFFLERYADAYRDEWAAFVEVLAGERAPSPDGEDGRRALLLAEAAYRSLATGRTVELSQTLEAIP